MNALRHHARSIQGVVGAIAVTMSVTLLGAAPPALALTTTDCRVCHATGNNVDRHHNLLQTKGLDCLNCHKLVLDPVSNTYVFAPYRDCLNCHTARVHIDRHGYYATSWQLLTGVEAGAAPLWTQIVSFTLKTPAAQEQQACLKCHSFYGFGSAPTGVSSVTGISGVSLTDQAMEFNPNNRSSHPIQVPLKSQTGSYAPRGLTVAQMAAPWTNVGNQRIKCSDCHDFSSATSGPQGSAGKFFLKGTRKLWPYNASGKYWTLADLKNNTNNWSNDLFCKNCHPLFASGKFMNNVHDDGDHHADTKVQGVYYKGVPCVSCHTTIPHGARRSRMIAYGYQSTTPDVPPYIINTNVNLMRGFKKASTPWGYNAGNCYSTSSECGDHNSPKMTYD